MPGDDLQPMVGYPGWVTWTGVGLVALAVVILVVALLLTRRPRPKTPPLDPNASRYGVVAYQQALQSISQVVARYDAHELDARAVHLALAAVLRTYASTRLGRDVTSLTASELRTLPRGLRPGPAETGATLESYLAPAFSGRQTPDEAVKDAARRAQMVINRW